MHVDGKMQLFLFIFGRIHGLFCKDAQLWYLVGVYGAESKFIMNEGVSSVNH
jgi:hypothetical protein